MANQVSKAGTAMDKRESAQGVWSAAVACNSDGRARQCTLFIRWATDGPGPTWFATGCEEDTYNAGLRAGVASGSLVSVVFTASRCALQATNMALKESGGLWQITFP